MMSQLIKDYYTVSNTHWTNDQFYVSRFVYSNRDKFVIFVPNILNTPEGIVLRHNWYKNAQMFHDMNTILDNLNNSTNLNVEAQLCKSNEFFQKEGPIIYGNNIKYPTQSPNTVVKDVKYIELCANNKSHPTDVIHLRQVEAFDEKNNNVSSSSSGATVQQQSTHKHCVATNLIDDDLNTYNHTQHGKDSTVCITLKNHTELSRLVLHNIPVPDKSNRLIGSGIRLLNEAKEQVWSHIFNKQDVRSKSEQYKITLYPTIDINPFRVAIVFFGLIRCGKKSWPSIKSNFLDVLSNTQHIAYDCFCHTYDLKKINNPRSKEINVCVEDIEYYANLLGTTKLKIENQEQVVDKVTNLSSYTKHGDPWNDKFKSLQNLLRQLHSLREATRMWQEHNKDYNAVLYLRSDLLYNDPIDMQALNWVLTDQTKNRIVIPSWDDGGGLNDRFAYGTPVAMNRYGLRGDHAEAYAKHHKMHSERFLKHIILSNKTELRRTSQTASRVRADGRVQEKPP